MPRALLSCFSPLLSFACAPLSSASLLLFSPLQLLPPYCVASIVLPQSCPVVSLTPFFFLLFASAYSIPCCLNRALSFHSHSSFFFLLFACAYSIPCCLNRALSFHSLPSFFFLLFASAYSIPCCLNCVASIASCHFTHTLLSCSSPLPALIPYRVASIVLPQSRHVVSLTPFFLVPPLFLRLFHTVLPQSCCLNCVLFTHTLLSCSSPLPALIPYRVASIALICLVCSFSRQFCLGLLYSM